MAEDSLGLRLRAWRKANHTKQKDLARQLGVSPRTVCRWEKLQFEPESPQRELVLTLLNDGQAQRLAQAQLVAQASTELWAAVHSGAHHLDVTVRRLLIVLDEVLTVIERQGMRVADAKRMLHAPR